MSKLGNIPDQHSFDVKQGLTLSFAARFHDPDLDVSAQTIRFRIRKAHSSPALLLELDNMGLGGITVGDTPVEIDPAGGTNNYAQVVISAAQTEALQVGNWVYDFERDDAGTVFGIISGSFTVIGQA